MKVTLYLAQSPDGSTKEREGGIGQALKAGFEKHGETVNAIPSHEFVRPDWESQLACIIGIKGHSKRIFEEYRRGGRQVMLVDKSYFGRSEYLRISVNGFQPAYAHTEPRPHDRWDAISREFKIKLKPRHTGGSTVIYAGSSQKYCNWHDLGDATEYAGKVCRIINKVTRSTLKLYYRPKPSWAARHPEDAIKEIEGTVFSGPDTKLSTMLPYCSALVTHGSNAAVEAVMAGVPAVLVSKGCCAAEPVAEPEIGKLREAFFPDDKARLQWLADLAYCQFTLDEIESGLAWDLTAPHTCKAGLQDYANLSPRESVIAQYRAMHESPKMFRGGSIKGHIEAIADLVAKHKPESMLDYGSGKGAQYDGWNVHEKWGGLKPVCYDPGYPPIAEKPAGKFDGVICTDVAEHWPEETVDDHLLDVIGYAKKFAFFCIFNEPSRKYLPDGRNAHLTCRPPAWWEQRVCELTGGTVSHRFDVSKPIPGGGYEKFPHVSITTRDGVEVVLTFRGGD